MGERKRQPQIEYEVSVWNHQGDVVKKLWHATAAEVEELERGYPEDEGFTIVIDDRRETTHG